MECHQVLVSASPEDGITHEALEIRALLRAWGKSEVFAHHIDPRLIGNVLPLTAYPERQPRAIDERFLIFHGSVGEPEVFSFLLDRPEPLIVSYHSISPSELFSPYDPKLAERVEEGRREVAALRGRAIGGLAHSAYAAGELHALGYRDVRISPVLLDTRALLSLEPHQLTINHFEKKVEGPMVLFVGKILPDKRLDLLLHAYQILVTYLIPETHLFLVGPSRINGYTAALQTFINDFNLGKAGIIGAVTIEQLVAYFQRAELFVTLAEYDDFCVPLLEAMAFDTPIVGRRRGAIPETVGDGGLLLPAEDDPLLAAEAMAAVLSDQNLAGDLVARGRKRLEAFDAENPREQFLEILRSLI
jgi:glycosyltransferase involved in cell wall biosynthesis